MTSRARFFATLLVVALAAGPVLAQRSADNAVRSAEDAFGATVGRETIGLYSPNDVRGFSAITAGNLRIDGLYFDQQEALTSHLATSTVMRVGLAAQGFAFPAPTGVVDYELRRPGGDRSFNVIAAGTSWGGRSLEFDGQTPVSDTFSIGAGAGFYHDVFGDGTPGDYRQFAVIANWRPLPDIQITPFYEWSPLLYNPATAIYVTQDGAPPASLPRNYHGPSWDAYRGRNENGGLVADMALGADTSLRLGAFHSVGTSRSTFAALFLDLSPDGRADSVIIADPPESYVSDSTELRLAHGYAEGPRRHLLIASLRGRAVESRYGGSDTVDFGATQIDAPGPTTEPSFVFGNVTHDQVRQWSVGLTYSLDWQGVGAGSVGVLHTDYRKQVVTLGSPVAKAVDVPLLWNASLALDAGTNVVVYASHTTGLEESGQAPDVAVNRGSLSPAIRTEQNDAGLRWKIAESLSLIAGVFEVKKPYDAVDGAGVFRRLGALANRGAEVSITGAPAPGWTVVAGAVFLDASVSGDAVRSGLIGSRPVGSTSIKAQAYVEYAPPNLPAWSFDVGVNGRGETIATTDNRSSLPSRVTLDIGLRYRFPVQGTASVLRLQITNLAATQGYVVLGPGAYKRDDDRKIVASLTTDL